MVCLKKLHMVAQSSNLFSDIREAVCLLSDSLLLNLDTDFLHRQNTEHKHTSYKYEINKAKYLFVCSSAGILLNT